MIQLRNKELYIETRQLRKILEIQNRIIKDNCKTIARKIWGIF